MEPTEEGKRRYPPHGVFQAAPDEEPMPCNCNDHCETRSIGLCGCLACAMRFVHETD